MLELKDFEMAADRLKNVIHNIPLSTSCTFSEMSGAEVYLKYENQQKTGSFKVRGAYNKIMKRYAEGDLHAVVASSAGNHAQGVAFAASSVGVKSTIVMPRSTPIAKVSATQGYGAEVVLAGNIYDEAYARACEICEETGAEFIHPFDDEDVMAGQGTIALEILRDLPFVDMIFVPAGGGGLISGVAACAKQINPRTRSSACRLKAPQRSPTPSARASSPRRIPCALSQTALRSKRRARRPSAIFRSTLTALLPFRTMRSPQLFCCCSSAPSRLSKPRAPLRSRRCSTTR